MKGATVSQEFSFDLQQVVDSDMVCADGVCFVPPTDQRADRADSHATPQHD
ncbi:hypothetical protein M2368_003049 [Arthrobacter sp. JUb119]|nr:hypothetical protein [Arthrobacter sp. JUb119]TDU23477.1 hypothetical protein EDF61_108130 [Arthrobacter sp. JUb115]